MRLLYVRLALVGSVLGGGLGAGLATGCATAARQNGDDTVDIDAGTRPDGSQLVEDAPPSGVDGCLPTPTNLLTNAAFDLQPDGTGWQATPINAMYPLVTSTGTLVAQSGTVRAWMGGITAGSGATVTDVLYQDVAIPAGATNIELKGYYELRTSEIGTGIIFDTGRLDLTSTTNTVLENILDLDDDGATTAWTPFSRTLSNSYAGQTVRVRMTTSNDDALVTSFYFDTLELNATVCQ